MTITDDGKLKQAVDSGYASGNPRFNSHVLYVEATQIFQVNQLNVSSDIV